MKYIFIKSLASVYIFMVVFLAGDLIMILKRGEPLEVVMFFLLGLVSTVLGTIPALIIRAGFIKKQFTQKHAVYMTVFFSLVMLFSLKYYLSILFTIR